VLAGTVVVRTCSDEQIASDQPDDDRGKDPKGVNSRKAPENFQSCGE
jgi:hypothetical protein